jgi:signal transduction histidine kinase/DNA-binding NarL/FixJ family response regulator
MAWRVLLVDDHAAFRAQARALLEAEGLHVVGEAADGAAALALLAHIEADVVLLDVLLPGEDGFAVAARIAALPHPLAVILTSTRDADAYGERIARAHVRGFLPKAALSGAAIERLLTGPTEADPELLPTRQGAASRRPQGQAQPAWSTLRRWVAGRSRSSWLRLLAWPLCLLVGLASIAWLSGQELFAVAPVAGPGYVFDPMPMFGVALVGWSTALAGLIAWTRRPDRLAGPLLVAAALAWFVGAVSWADDTGTPYSLAIYVRHAIPALPINDGGAFQGYYVLLMVALVLAYPAGRLASPAARVLVAGLGAVLLASTVARVLVVGGPFGIACDLPDPTCVSGPALYNDISGQTTDLYNTLDLAFRCALLAGAVLATAIVLSRWWRARGPGRRVLLPALGMGLGLSVAVGLAVLRRQPGFDTAVPDALRAASVVALAALPQAFTFDLLRGRLARTGVADLVVQLEQAPAPEGMAAALGRTLGDRSVAVLVWSPETSAYLDAAGRPAELPTHDPTRAVTLLARDGQPVGALVHDAALREDPGLLASVSAAAATAIENDRLQAEVRAQLEEVRASRARIVAAGDEQRARIERDLHDGAQQQLVALAIALRSARRRVDAASEPELARTLSEASERAESAVSELRELAGGIHPAILVEAGLPAALASLARRATLPVTVEAPLPDRLPAPVEATAYFLVSEALANTAKHAHAREAHVRAERVGDQLHIEVSDDGIGGADLARGTGLRGLSDRVAALNGSLRVESPRGGGTRLTAEIPCAS